MPSPQTSLGAFILINFTLFHHFQDFNGISTNSYGEHYLLTENKWKSYGGMMETLGIEMKMLGIEA